MCVFTRENRSATVKASRPYTVMNDSQGTVPALMAKATRAIAHSLIESMARRRSDLMNKDDPLQGGSIK